MSFNNVIYEKGGVATLTLNRPDISNGFNIPTCQETPEVLDNIKSDDSVKILVIKAVRKVFSIGGDLAEIQHVVESDNVESLVEIASLIDKVSFAMKKLPKPVTMSVDGAVAGAAVNMAAAVDFVVASERAKFIQVFVGVGFAPDVGDLFLMSRAIDTARAIQLAITGEGLNAQKVLEHGIVHRLCEPEKLERTTNQLTKRLLRGSANSYRAIKEMSWKAFSEGWKDYTSLRLQLQEELAFKEDFKEGVRTFAEKRRPKFSGK